MTNSETYEDDEENSAPRSSYSTYLAEGAILFKQGEFKKAIESYSLALEIKENDPTCLVARSKCYLKLGDPQKALQDAETVLSENKDSIKGLCQKAEALYCIGDFEYALVYYHRGHKLCPELDEFRLGIQKAQEAIENSIGKAAKIKLEAKGDLSFFSKQDDFSTKKRGLLKQTPLIQIKPPIASRNKDVKLPAPSKKTVKQLLGELYADKEYLEKLINDDRFLKNNTKSPIYELVQGGLSFLETRTEFWRQQRPIYARKKEVRKLKSTVKKKSKSDVGKYVLQQLEDIDHALGNFDPERGLRLAKNLLNFTKEIDEKELPHKIEVIANAHSCIGNALIDLDELPKALKHHQRDLQISKKSQSDSIGISRALGNIGRAKAKMGKFEDAIQSWEEKMQYIKTPLEATWLYHELGRSYLELNSLDTALSYGLKSLAAAKEGNDEFWQLNANVLIAQAYGNQKNFESSIAAFEEALSLADITGDKIAKTAITKAINDTKAKSEIYASDNLANSSNEQIKLDCQISSNDLDENMFNSGDLSNDYKQKINNIKNVYTECDVTEQLNECDETEQLNDVDSFFDHTYQDDIKNQHCESLDCTTNTSGNNSNIISESSLNTIKSDRMSYKPPRSEKIMNFSSSDANVSSIYDGNSVEETERDESKLFENFTGKLDDTCENIFKSAPEVKRIDVQLEENNALVLKSDLTPSLGLILENFLPGKEIDFIETHTEHRINATHTEHLINEIHTEHLVNVTCNELQVNETCTENLVNEIHTEHLVDEVHTEHRINETCIELQINETHTKHRIDETHTEHRNNETYNDLQINETYIEHKVNETHTEHQINKVLKIEAHAEPPLGEINAEPPLGETNAEQQIITTEKNELSDQVFNYETSFQTSYSVTSNEPSNLLVLESSIMLDENLKTVNFNTTTHYENESPCNESITFTENLTAVNDILLACNENKALGDKSLYNENSTPFIENDIEFNKNERKFSLNIIACNQNETACNENETPCNENETPCNENETPCNENETACNENESVNFNYIKTPSEDLIQCKDNEIASNESLLFCNKNSIAYNEKRNASALDLQSEVEDQLTNKNNNDQRFAIASHHTTNYERNSITEECEIANNYERNSISEDCEIANNYERNTITEGCEIAKSYERNSITEDCEITNNYERNNITEDCEMATKYERNSATKDCEIANSYKRSSITEDCEIATKYEHSSTTKDCEVANNYERNSITEDCEMVTNYERNSATKDCEIANNYKRNSITEDYEIANNYQHSKTNEITIDKSD